MADIQKDFTKEEAIDFIAQIAGTSRKKDFDTVALAKAAMREHEVREMLEFFQYMCYDCFKYCEQMLEEEDEELDLEEMVVKEWVVMTELNDFRAWEGDFGKRTGNDASFKSSSL